MRILPVLVLLSSAAAFQVAPTGLAHVAKLQSTYPRACSFTELFAVSTNEEISTSSELQRAKVEENSTSSELQRAKKEENSSTFSELQPAEMEENSISSELQPANMEENIFKFNKVLIDSVYDLICFLYPVTGSDRDYARFFVLETVARVPYFAYLSVLHLRETFGYRDDEDRMRTHYAEADNELHHLLIMEHLGGNSRAVDRNIAHFMAFFYYWYVVAVYTISAPAAYHLSELIEDHAYNTYDKFLKEHEEMLKSKPVPPIATKYYIEDNPYMRDAFRTVKDKDENGREISNRRPKLETLYDVFVNVRDDEKEHWKTLCNLVQYDSMNGVESKYVKSTEALVGASTK
eukprot:CAMPEP_0198143594 /NCGR_PEP_ID=MMETSP1443-20131203/8559_1 /TAXON_ID=186043 /ORGANISM="Entomoneis sp., Strain CCMP2396" /LENGTH=347 /DNA_ID=CAMNT_0043806857 /DNA_START=52 /DNA_END=1095 /DNA_ORIENTATION=-